jgi:hypothetical protein
LRQSFGTASQVFATSYLALAPIFPFQGVFIESYFDAINNQWPRLSNSEPALTFSITESIINSLIPNRRLQLMIRTHTVEEILVDPNYLPLLACAITTAHTAALERLTIDPTRLTELFSNISVRFFSYLRLMASPHSLACEVFTPILLLFLRLQYVA